MGKIKKVLHDSKLCITLAILLLLIKLITTILIDIEIVDFIYYNNICFISMLIFALASSELKHKRLIFLVLYTGFAILMFADSMYYNYYHQTVSVSNYGRLKC